MSNRDSSGMAPVWLTNSPAPRWWRATAAFLMLCWCGGSRAEAAVGYILQNTNVRYVLGADGRNLSFEDRRTGRDYLDAAAPTAFAEVRQAGHVYQATALHSEGNRVEVEFGTSGASATFRVTARPLYLRIEVQKFHGPGVDYLAFGNVPLTLKGNAAEPFAACALALNLQTDVPEIPRPSARLHAYCYERFGFVGAAVALVATPSGGLRAGLRSAVSEAKDLPHSALGGPWALGKPITQGSYLFNFGNMSEKTVDDWIAVAHSLGVTQIDFHGGSSFRFGDCAPNPETYPHGLASFKAVIDRLHKAGISAGLHTYAFFIDKRCPWVTPKPDPRLGKDATLTLAGSLSADAAGVPAVESTRDMSAVTGFFVRNSNTVRIDDELITYTGVAKEPPYGFTGCRRGAWGTHAAAHADGAKIYHLKECFGLFTPDADSTLLAEVAAHTAETFNTCGFDMIYLDALDGEDILGGGANAWHYGSKFVYEICKRLKKPALMEMSTFHHHLWCVRSRMGAWDHPSRTYKRFIDIHCKANEENRAMFLPGELGWWAFATWSGPQGEPTFSDDIEYLMCKCLGNDTGFALMGIDPTSVKKTPALPRLAAITKRYEDLRHSNRVPEAVKALLRAPNADYTLTTAADGTPQFSPAQYSRHKVEGIDGWSDAWHVSNRFTRQPARFRIEALMAAAPYDSPGAIPAADIADPAGFSDRAAAPRVTADLTLSPIETRPCYRLTASNAAAAERSAGSAGGSANGAAPPAGLDVQIANASGAWVKFERRFETPLNLAGHEALGLWVRGDGKGEVLNVQLQCPQNVVAGIGEHYIPIDFTGWRYVTLVEPESERYTNYAWPYGDLYSIYRENVAFDQIAKLGIWVNNVPAGGSVECDLSALHALPLVKTKLIRPAITIGGRTIVFPVEMESGSYLEFNSPTDCKLYGPKGELIQDVKPEGEAPTLDAGDNDIRFACTTPKDVAARAYVTVSGRGEPIRATR